MKTALSIRSAFKTVAAAGTPEPLVAVSSAQRHIDHGVVAIVARKAKATANTGNVYVGNRESQNLALAPGGHIVLRATGQRSIDLSDIMVDAVTSADGVLWVWSETEVDLANALANLAVTDTALATIFGATTTAPVADNTTVADATAANGIGLWKRLVNLGIAILAKLPTIGTSRTPGLAAITSASGTIAAGGQSIGIITSSDWVGTIGGASFPANASMSWSANPGDTVGSLAYTRSAGTLYAGTLT